ncbi:hypothetical protein ABEY43_26150 [Priestia megaterium]|uniref:hypothetical protein n=1 Tax=Priestia megaterium TaxID=1404 RepID=UPI002E1B754A|nr:hypothetical protein [Priestia megaterium]
MEPRGMKKWHPFATMPEQYIGLQEVIKRQLEVPQPVLTKEQNEAFELKNKMRLSELIDVRFM